MAFEVNITIPDDFEIDITDYELWINNVMVGERTPKDKPLRHLGLDLENLDEVKIRLYNGAEFVDDCVIDPSEESGPLTITSGYDIEKKEGDQLGTFTIELDDYGMLTLKITPDDEAVKSFGILSEDGKHVGGEDKTDITKEFTYLAILQQSLDDLEVELYDESGAVLHVGRFDSLNGVIKKIEE